MLTKLAGSAKALVPILLVAVLAILEQFGVNVDINQEHAAAGAGAGLLTWLVPNRTSG